MFDVAAAIDAADVPRHDVGLQPDIGKLLALRLGDIFLFWTASVLAIQFQTPTLKLHQAGNTIIKTSILKTS